jgi:hypothetical protein
LAVIDVLTGDRSTYPMASSWFTPAPTERWDDLCSCSVQVRPLFREASNLGSRLQCPATCGTQRGRRCQRMTLTTALTASERVVSPVQLLVTVADLYEPKDAVRAIVILTMTTL